MIITIKYKSEPVEFIIDDDLFNIVNEYQWGAHKKNNTFYIKGYKKGFRKNCKFIYLHHLIIGKACQGYVVDHINRNPLDNRRQNLRFVTRSINGLNRDKENWGISKKYDNKWRARIMVNGKHYDLGSFNCPKEAKKAYDNFKLKILDIASWDMPNLILENYTF